MVTLFHFIDNVLSSICETIHQQKMQNIHKTVSTTKSRKVCSVRQCTTCSTVEHSLHHFPWKNVKLCDVWKNILKIDRPITKSMLVCSKHFLKEDFLRTTNNRRLLKKGMVPSQNLPKSSDEVSKPVELQESIQKHNTEVIACSRNSTNIIDTMTTIDEIIIIKNEVDIKVESEIAEDCTTNDEIQSFKSEEKQFGNTCIPHHILINTDQFPHEANFGKQLLADKGSGCDANIHTLDIEEIPITKSEKDIKIESEVMTNCTTKNGFQMYEQQFSNTSYQEQVNTDQLYNCRLCQSTFPEEAHLWKHMLSHQNTKQIQCSLCNYKYTKTSSPKTHMRMHSGEKSFTCSLCDYKCLKRSHLKVHMLTHSDEKPFVCNLCNYKCSVKSNLKQHMLTHSGDKPFKCNLCDYKFLRKSHLKVHILTHTGEKSFECNLCDYKCLRKGHLKVHMLTHGGENSFQCNLCNYKCKLKSSLKTHIAIHSIKKLFQCGLCNYKCSLKSGLKIHMFSHPGVKPLSKLSHWGNAQIATKN